MEALIVIGIIAVIAIWIGISALIRRLKDGKKAHDDLGEARSEFYDLKKQCDAVKEEHKQQLHKLRRKIEQQGDIIHNVKRESKHNQERCEETVKKIDQLFEQIKKKNNESLEYISSQIADHLTLQYEISAEPSEN